MREVCDSLDSFSSLVWYNLTLCKADQECFISSSFIVALLFKLGQPSSGRRILSQGSHMYCVQFFYQRLQLLEDVFIFQLSLYQLVFFLAAYFTSCRSVKRGNMPCCIVSLFLNHFSHFSYQLCWCHEQMFTPHKKVIGVAPPLGKVSFLNVPERDCFLISNWENRDSVEVFLVTCLCVSAIHLLITIAVNAQDIWTLLWSCWFLRCKALLPFYLVFLKKVEKLCGVALAGILRRHIVVG